MRWEADKNLREGSKVNVITAAQGQMQQVLELFEDR